MDEELYDLDLPGSEGGPCEVAQGQAVPQPAMFAPSSKHPGRFPAFDRVQLSSPTSRVLLIML